MLTKEQMAAVTTEEPFSVVLAGAGSGKTTLLAERVLHLINKGVPPQCIMAITFTRKAARELKERLGDYGKDMPIGTFHAICLAALPYNLNVLDEEQAAHILDQCAISHGLAISSGDRVEYIKNTRSHWAKHVHQHRITNTNSPLTDTYLSKLAINGDIDYDGILHRGLEMARNKEGLWGSVEHIILDEAQDTSRQQWDIIHATGASVMAVGDIAQSLFSWAGADPSHLASLPWPRFELTESFRCPHVVTDMVNSFPMQHVTLRTSKGAGTAKLVEGDDVEGLVEWLVDEGLDESDIAVLCRYNSQVDDYRERLFNRGWRVHYRHEEPRGAAYRMLCYLSHLQSVTAREFARKAIGKTITEGAATFIVADMPITYAAILCEQWLAGQPLVGSILSNVGVYDDTAYYIRHYGDLTLAEWARQNSPLDAFTSSPTTGITVETIHSTKGGEWMAVVVPGLDSWPRKPTEDEWRVFYVAVTRTSDSLYLMCNGEPAAFAAHCMSLCNA